MKKIFSVMFVAATTILAADEIQFKTMDSWQKSKRLSESSGVFTLRGSGRLFSNEFLLVDTTARYKLSMKIRRVPGSPAFRSHIGFAQFDEARVELQTIWYRAESRTETTLRQNASQGVKTIVVGKPTWWPKDALRRGWGIAFDTKSDFSDLPNRTVLRLKNWKETSPGILTLTVNGTVANNYPAGTSVRFHSPGPLMYPVLAGKVVEEKWTEVSGTVFGENKFFHNNRWWRGATFCKLLISNSPTTGDHNLRFEFKDVVLVIEPTVK
jgi:hypothetical protein